MYRNRFSTILYIISDNSLITLILVCKSITESFTSFVLCFLNALFIIQATLVLKKNIKFFSLHGKFSRQLPTLLLECYMDWFLSLICKNYIFKYFVKTIEPASLKFCMIIELISLHLEYTIAHVKYANFSYAHAQTFVLLNGEMATVSTGFRKLKFWLWLLWTVFYLNQTGF